jgi:diguanylate cyclase (GGDEF)-like protein
MDASRATLEAENAQLRERLESAERYTAQTLARATRLSQVIAVLGHHADFDAVIDHAAVEVAELFSADIALVLVGPDDAICVEGQWGVRKSDVPEGRFPLPGLGSLTAASPVLIGEAGDVALPPWLERYGAAHVAWARLMVGEESLGVMLLIRRSPEPFGRSDEKELGAIAYRIALAMENGLLHRRMSDQLVRLGRIQEFTSQLAGTLELEPVARRVAETLVREVRVAGSVVLVERDGELAPAARCGSDDDLDAQGWSSFPLESAGKSVGRVLVADAPETGSEEHDLLAHLVGLAALAIDKALLYERSREQARQDSLTGLLGHRVFHEVLEEQTGQSAPFSVVLVDIDDFKQINDLYGHQTGHDALRYVADALRRGIRGHDNVFRVGGEEFCVVLPGLEHADAVRVAERLRRGVADIASVLPVTVSLGVASYPTHGLNRDELLTKADAALYASKRAGKNAPPSPAPTSCPSPRWWIATCICISCTTATPTPSCAASRSRRSRSRSRAPSASTTSASARCAPRPSSTMSARSACPTRSSASPAPLTRRSTASCRRTRSSAPSCCAPAGSTSRRSSSPSTTSTSTAPAIRAAWPATRSPSRPGSSTSPTRTSR